MLSEVAFFDEKGLLPSHKVRTIDDYLKEAESNFAILERLKKDPEAVVREHLGISCSVTALVASSEYSDRFYKSTLTLPWPAILVEEATYCTLAVAKKNLLLKLLLKERYKVGVATIVDIGLDKSKLFIPMVKRGEDAEDEYSNSVCHETVHGIRSQFRNETFHSPSVEEVVAYKVNEPPNALRESLRNRLLLNGSNLVNVLPPAMLLVMSPLPMGLYALPDIIFNYVVPYPVTPLAMSLALAGVGAYFTIDSTIVAKFQGKRTIRFVEQCEQEGLNPNYLYLRSDPSEFSAKKPIAQQLEENKKLRFQIMAYRLGIKS